MAIGQPSTDSFRAPRTSPEVFGPPSSGRIALSLKIYGYGGRVGRHTTWTGANGSLTEEAHAVIINSAHG